MTGREQFKWYRAFEIPNYTHLRHAENTIGLRGTDLGRIANVNQLTDCIHQTPSLKRRRTAGHAITVEQWDNASAQAECRLMPRRLQF